jgi:hypothetical protein
MKAGKVERVAIKDKAICPEEIPVLEFVIWPLKSFFFACRAYRAENAQRVHSPARSSNKTIQLESFSAFYSSTNNQ